jgi:glycosyltransferase involved in cell wall biosynthesis
VEFDVVNFPEWGAEGFAYLLDRPRGPRVPAVVHLHGPLAMFSEHLGWPERGSLLDRVGTAMEDVSIERADGLMASSAHIADFVAGRHGLDRASIDVVHTGIDGEAFRPPSQRTPSGRPTVLFVGNIAHNKGIETLFEAVLRLRGRHPDILLQIVGSGNEHLVGDLQRRARLAGADGNVQFCGFVPRERLPEIYGEAHVFASPAQYEFGVANVYVEAMACGCPVVASDAGGAPEAVVHGETGLLVPPNDVGAVVAALDQILADTPLRRRMSDAARRRVDEYFTLDRYIVRVLGAYERAIDRATAASV